MNRSVGLLCLVFGAVGCSSGPTRRPDTVYTGRAVTIANGLLLTDGGSLICGAAGQYGRQRADGVVQLTYSGIPLARNGDVFELHCESVAGGVPTVWASGVAEIIGPNVFRRADGSTFFQVDDQFLDLPELSGATSCNRSVCLRAGMVILNSSTWKADRPVIVDPPQDPWVAQSFANCTKEKLLAADGRAYEVEYETGPPPTLSFIPLDILPPISRMDGTFMYDRDGNAYYTGVVWAPNASMLAGLSTTMLPPGTPTFACHCVQKVTSTCVGPTLVPKLKDARMGSIYGLATYAIQPDGTVKCWATEPTRYSSNAPRCLSFD